MWSRVRLFLYEVVLEVFSARHAEIAQSCHTTYFLSHTLANHGSNHREEVISGMLSKPSVVISVVSRRSVSLTVAGGGGLNSLLFVHTQVGCEHRERE